MFNCCSHGTLLHFGLQSSRLNICYFHQDLHRRSLHSGSRPKLLRWPPRPSYSSRLIAPCARTTATVRYRLDVRASSIFRADWFGRWVVTHSLAVSDFHGHRPAVYINQHLLWSLMNVPASDALTERSVHPASPVLLTKSGPLGTRIHVSRLQSSESDFLPI